MALGYVLFTNESYFLVEGEDMVQYFVVTATGDRVHVKIRPRLVRVRRIIFVKQVVNPNAVVITGQLAVMFESPSVATYTC